MTTDHNGPSVTASDIGQAARCPYALYLHKQGLDPDRATQQLKARGTRQHERWTRAQEPGGLGRWLKACAQLIIIGVGVMVVLAIAAAILAG